MWKKEQMVLVITTGAFFSEKSKTCHYSVCFSNFMVHKKTLHSWIYLSTAFSNWKHQKLSGDENRDISSCRWVRLCRVMTHSEGPYLSSTRIQCLQLRAFKCVISSAVKPFLPQLKMSSTIRGIGAHTSYSSGGRSPFNTNSDAGKANFWYSSAVKQNISMSRCHFY